MSESSKRHSKFLSLIFILKCLSKASVISNGKADNKRQAFINTNTRRFKIQTGTDTRRFKIQTGGMARPLPWQGLSTGLHWFSSIISDAN